MQINHQQPPIHLIDDEAALREACKFLLENMGYCVQLWEDGQQFLEGVNIQEKGVVIVDIRMPNLSGDQLQKYLYMRNSPLALIILTGHGELSMAVSMLKEGVVDFLQKPVGMMQLAQALTRAIEVTNERYQQINLLELYKTLSPRETQVAAQVVAGRTNKEISEDLHISIRTVEVQRSNAMQKMHAETLAEFVQKVSQVMAL